MEICLISCVARYMHDNSIQSCWHCKNMVKLSHKVLTMLAAVVLTSYAFTVLYSSMMATKILQASHRHCKMPAPGWHEVSSPPPKPCDAMPAISKKMFNSSLDCL